MTPILFFVLIGFLATVGAMFAGSISMARGGEYDRAHSFLFMEARVILQALTVGLILLAVLAW